MSANKPKKGKAPISDLLKNANEDADRNTKLGRRRLIEDLYEQKMLEAEFNEYEVE